MTAAVQPAFSIEQNYILSPPEWKHAYSGPLVGINGFNNIILAVGYEAGRYTDVRIGGVSAYTNTLGGSIEVQVHSGFRIQPKLSARFSCEWRSGFKLQPVCGSDYVLFNDFHTTNHVLRPVAGMQFATGGVTIVYGYHLQLDKNPVILPSRHNVQITAPLFLFWLLAG